MSWRWNGLSERARQRKRQAESTNPDDIARRQAALDKSRAKLAAETPEQRAARLERRRRAYQAQKRAMIEATAAAAVVVRQHEPRGPTIGDVGVEAAGGVRPRPTKARKAPADAEETSLRRSEGQRRRWQAQRGCPAPLVRPAPAGPEEKRRQWAEAKRRSRQLQLQAEDERRRREGAPLRAGRFYPKDDEERKKRRAETQRRRRQARREADELRQLLEDGPSHGETLPRRCEAQRRRRRLEREAANAGVGQRLQDDPFGFVIGVSSLLSPVLSLARRNRGTAQESDRDEERRKKYSAVGDAVDEKPLACHRCKLSSTTFHREPWLGYDKCVGEDSTLPQHADRSCQTEHHITLVRCARLRVSTCCIGVQVDVS
ncbi:uncharacterized protein LOC119453320 isoform X1 [Dermacentor silvarum]|uniref:uncharacterized protein LOC119453320 isoform X1 n=1 Tax=Dermacentor silvarum TaxID=543639 RepID=UPI002101BE56|nr:uncharacterized protein LOC119453320 isoform X1 [Dermacentor silvarum]